MEDYYIYVYLDPMEDYNIEIGGVLIEKLPIYVGKGRLDRLNDHIKFLHRNYKGCNNLTRFSCG